MAAAVLSVSRIEGGFSKKYERRVGYFRVEVVNHGWVYFYGDGRPVLKAENTLRMSALFRLWPVEVTQYRFPTEDGGCLVIDRKVRVSLEYNTRTQELRLEPQITPVPATPNRLTLEQLAGIRSA